MRHLVSGRKLNRNASHRRAMLANLAVSILDKERVTTTVAKAKEVRGVVERLITYGKKGKDNLHAIRLAARWINDERISEEDRAKKRGVRDRVLKKLFEDIAPSYAEREGGYTRVLKTENRKGDNAPMAIIELVGRAGHNDPVRKRSAKKKKAAPKAKKPAAAAPVAEAPVTDEAVEAAAVEASAAEETTPEEKTAE